MKNKKTFIAVLIAIAIVFWFFYTISTQNQSGNQTNQSPVAQNSTENASTTPPDSVPASQ
jgi:heme/copper-type cytochrome/quinol oxidase subunit 1